MVSKKDDERKEAIRLRVEEQKSITHIASVLKVSKGSVSFWLRDYPLSEEQRKANGWNIFLSDDEKNALKNDFEKYVNDGLRIHDIMELTSRSKSSVSHWLRTFGLRIKVPEATLGEDGKALCSDCGVALIESPKQKGWRCKSCVYIYNRAWAKKIKQQAVDYKGGSCIKCGYSSCLSAMEFHHRNPAEKDFSIAGKRWNIDRLRKELDKCDLLCCRCHREEHETLHKNRMEAGQGLEP